MPGHPLPRPLSNTLPGLPRLSAWRRREGRQLLTGAERAPTAGASTSLRLQVATTSPGAIGPFVVGCIAALCLLLAALTLPPTAAATEPAPSVASRAVVHVVLRGQVPTEEYPAVQSKSDRIWSYLVERFALSPRAPTPTVQFQPFDLARQSPGWSAWQKGWIRTHPAIWRDWSAMRPARPATAVSPDVSSDLAPDVSPEWINRHIDSVFPFPRNFLAFHYDGTNRIQIDPRRAFIDSMQVFIDGERRGRSGQGFYSLGHEMLHYALELRGVEQKKLHHCLMLYTEGDGDTPPALMPALMEEVADHLVGEQIIAPIARLRGLRTEHSLRPCSRLTDEELAQVADFRERLAPEGSGATAGVTDGAVN